MKATTDEGALAPEHEAAIGWSIRLSSEHATLADHAGFRDWIASSGANERAWRALSSSLGAFAVAGRHQARPGAFADGALRLHATRRDVLGGVAAVGAVGTAAASVANRFVPLSGILADHATGTGQLKRVALAGGTSLVLGPRTAVDAALADAVETISLDDGEIMASATRPLELAMPDMVLSAARGTFVARRFRGGASAFALDAAASVTCGGGPATRLAPGQRIAWDGSKAVVRAVGARTQTGWVEGRLYVEDEALGEVVDRLRPYLVGVVRVDPAVAGMPVTGVFPLDDLALALDTLARALDVSVRRVTPFWISVGPKPTTL